VQHWLAGFSKKHAVTLLVMSDFPDVRQIKGCGLRRMPMLGYNKGLGVCRTYEKSTAQQG